MIEFVLLKEYLADMGPGALIELHQHMVRSPPPTTWPRIPIFKYDEKDQSQVLLLFQILCYVYMYCKLELYNVCLF